MMTLWAIAPSPLMLGMNMPENDAWTLSLLTNDEVLAVNQDPLGRQGVRISAGRKTWKSGRKTCPAGQRRSPCSIGEAPIELDESRAVYKSPLVTRKTPGQSVAIEVDITGAKKLYLVVDDGGDGYFCDHADWIEPELTGPQGGESSPPEVDFRHLRLG